MMSEEIALQLRNRLIVTVFEEKRSVVDYVRLMEGKASTVFLTDEKGIFKGKSISRSVVKKSWRIKDNSIDWVGKFVSTCSLEERMFNNLSKEKQTELLSKLIFKYPEQDEIPIIDADGKIVSVIERKCDTKKVNWELGNFPAMLSDYERIYLSTLCTDNLQFFYHRFHMNYPIFIFNDKCIDDALLNSKNVLLFEEDFFPDCNKINLVECGK